VAISLPLAFAISLKDKQNVERVAGTDLLQLNATWEKELDTAPTVRST
jgi:hypothetical protein